MSKPNFVNIEYLLSLVKESVPKIEDDDLLMVYLDNIKTFVNKTSRSCSTKILMIVLINCRDKILF